MVGLSVRFQQLCPVAGTHLPHCVHKEFPDAISNGVLAILGHQNDVRIQIMDYVSSRTIFMLIAAHI